jgi:cobalt-zinc-cadmium efflux system protein
MHAHADPTRDVHRHSPSQGPADYGRAFAIGLALNLGFVVVEALFGAAAHSVALMSDAGHNLGDALGLGVAWLASALAQRAPSARFTYGLRGSSILAALFNAALLFATVGALSWEAARRLADPAPSAGATVMVVALAGIVVNGATAALFASGRADLNLRGAFLHMAADAVVSAGVALAGLATLLTGWERLDPLVGLAVNAAIAISAWGLLRDSVAMSMAAAPRHIDPAAVRAFLASQPGVASVHDLHVWPMSTTETALTCHLVMPGGHPGDAFLHQLSHELDQRFSIVHATAQIETDPELACALAPDEVV